MAPSLKDFYLKNFKLPNGGGTFQSPAPIVQGTENPMPQATWGNGAPVYQNPLQSTPITTTPAAKPLFTPAATTTPAPAPAPTATRSKYMNPATGKYFTPQEYANYVALKIPASKANGDIPQYAGDAMTNPDESAAALTARATNLNNTRNDIATGTTDPYKAGAQSGIAYSPQELAAIEKAYSGIYDPALNDVFARLKERKDTEDKKAAREEAIFQTNENIRQWKATTGLTSGSGSDLFTRTQLNNGAANSGLGIGVFEGLDSDIKNFYINPDMELNPQTNKMVPQYESFSNLVKGATTGQITSKEAADEIMSSTLPQVVKLYFIDQLPLDAEEKKHWYQKLADWLAK